MKVEYINSFYKATLDVFKMMIDIEPEKGDLKVVEDMVCSRDVNVLLGVTGDLMGNILFNFPENMALEMIKIMSGMEMDKIDSFASSALGEVANIIGGNALTNLSETNCICDITPPQIFLGHYKSFSLANDKALLLTLITPIGNFDTCIFIKER